MSLLDSETIKSMLPRTSEVDQQDHPLRQPLRYRMLVVDLGDVLCSWSTAKQPTPISAFDLKKIIESPDWHDYERGRLTKGKCFARVVAKFGLRQGDLEETMHIFRNGMRWNDSLVKEIRKLKALSREELRVVLMTNISQPDFEDLKPVLEEWNIFDQMYTSAASNARKPELAFFQSVLQDSGMDAESALFVDDRNENVMLAQTAGMCGILFDDTPRVVHELYVMLGDPVSRARTWMKAQRKEMWSRTETGIEIHDQFSHLVMLEMLVDRDLLVIHEGLRHWNTFVDKAVLTDADFPDDLDTTTFALLNLEVDEETKNSVLDEMLEYPRVDGLFTAFFNTERPRYCPYVTANILRIFYAQGRANEVTDAVERMIQILESGAYRFNTRYYPSPEWFLYYLADLCARNSTASELDRLRLQLRNHIRTRIGGSNSNDLATAIRILSAQLVGLEDEVGPDLSALLRNQDLDGSWNRNPWTWKYGRTGMRVFHVGLTTATAARAIKNADEDRIKQALRVW